MVVQHEDIKLALDRISQHIHRTPCLTSKTFDQNFCPGKLVHFKCENFQKCGSFKVRGALNAVMKLKEEQPQVSNVITLSSGNFGQALAYAATSMGLGCYVVCPANSSQTKKEAAIGYGAHVTECEPTDDFNARQMVVHKMKKDLGAVFVHSCANADVICGQGSAGLEILDQVPDVDAILVPVGGGGLISGISTAVKRKHSKCKVFALEPEGADDAKRSFDSRILTLNESYPTTICDGLRTSISEITLEHMLEYVDDVILVSDAEVKTAIKFLLSRMKICVEPSGAIGVAALMNQDIVSKYLHGCEKIVVVLSGGNFDFISQSHLIG